MKPFLLMKQLVACASDGFTSEPKMSVKRSKAYLTELWPSTAQLKERYSSACKSIELNSASKDKNDAHFSEFSVRFKAQLLSFYVKVSLRPVFRFCLKLN